MRYRTGLQVGVIAAVVVFVFWPALWGGWIFDDELDILYNPVLRSVTGLITIWRHPEVLYDFYPIKYTVQWIQWQLWQENTFPYHVTTLAFHVTGALLFWRLLRRLGVEYAWVGGLLFAIHPIVVESVAWNVELKNTLSLPPLLLATMAYIDYVERGARRTYVAALAWYVVSMLCKSSGAPLPAFLLLFVWWKRGGISRRDLLVSAPFFAVSLAISAVAIWFQHERGIAGNPIVMEFSGRLALVCSTWFFYAWKCLWPADLMPIYPQWDIAPPSLWQFLPAVLLIALLVWLWRRRHGRARHGLLGLGWFLLFIAPASGVFLISYMRFTWVMDHMAYVASLGIIGLIVASVSLLKPRTIAPASPSPVAPARPRRREQVVTPAQLSPPPASFRKLPYAVFAAMAGLYGWISRGYAPAFQSDVAFWSYAVQRNPTAWMAHNNLGVALRKRGDVTAELAHYKSALRLKPNYAEAHGNMGDLLLRGGQIEEALVYFRRAIALRPDLAGAHAGLGKTLRAAHRLTEAADAFATSVRIRPDDIVVWNEYALCLADANRVEEAIEQLRKAVRLNPHFAEGHNNLALLLQRAGRLDEAVECYEKAIVLVPGNAEYHFNLARTFQAQRRPERAIRCYERAIQLKPDFADAFYGLGISLYLSGEIEAAKSRFARARALNPNLPPVDF
jgi:protein O-mannosyl-transferase